MKAITSIIIVLTLILGVGLICMPSYTYSETYTETATVTAIDGDTVTVEMDGESFAFYGDGFSVGDTVILTVDDNGTVEDITDDAIIDAVCE